MPPGPAAVLGTHQRSGFAGLDIDDRAGGDLTTSLLAEALAPLFDAEDSATGG